MVGLPEPVGAIGLRVFPDLARRRSNLRRCSVAAVQFIGTWSGRSPKVGVSAWGMWPAPSSWSTEAFAKEGLQLGEHRGQQHGAVGPVG